jgi:hypothetical protein
MPKWLLLKRRARAPARATNVAERDHLVRRAGRSGRPSCRRTTTRSSTDSKERKVMDPQEITEEPQDRTGSWVRRHDEYTPQELAGGRS